METINFVNRINELNYLNENYKKNIFSFISIIGRRRVGKTTLIERFLLNKSNYIYFYLTETNDEKLRYNFAKSLYDSFNISFFGSPNWDEILKKLFEHSIKNQIIVVIDEFQRLFNINKEVFSLFQKYIDFYHKKSRLFLIVSGSSIGMMNSMFSYTGALYGRRTGNIKLDSLNFEYLNDWFENKLEIKELIRIYSFFGGTPKYLTTYDIKKSLIENIKNEILLKTGILYSEPDLLIKTEISDSKTYFNILNSISLGKTRQNEIANFSGVKNTSLPYYLGILENELNLIYKENPITEKKSKNSHYYIKDNFFNFWFKYIYSNLSLLELNRVEKVLETIQIDLNKIVSFVFEDICKDFILTINIFNYSNVGRQWGSYTITENKKKITKTYEIDICGINEDRKEILFGEVKWQDNVDPNKILEELKEKTQYVKWNLDGRKEEFVIFAKSFKLNKQEMTKIEKKKFEKDNNCKLFDLKDIEREFK